MRLITWIWFWYVIVGFLMGGGAVMLWQTLKKLSLKLKWYEWLMTFLCFVLFMFMGQTFIASYQEYEPQAAWLTLVFLGIPIVILSVLLYRMLAKRYNSGARFK